MNKSIHRASGQASAEVLLAAAVLLTLCLAIAWIGRLQQRGLAADQASRQAAFSAAQGQPEPSSTVGRGLQYARIAPPPGFLPIGGLSPGAAALRRDWRVEDEGLLRSSAHIGPESNKTFTPLPTDGNGRSQSDPTIWRHTWLLTGDGHAADDLTAQNLLARSKAGWQHAYGKSSATALNVNPRLAPLDQPWSRAPLQTDWLAAWPDLIPKDRLQPASRN